MPAYDEDEFDWNAVFGGGHDSPDVGNPYLPPGEGGGPDSPPGTQYDQPGSDGGGTWDDFIKALGSGAGSAKDLFKMLGLGQGSGLLGTGFDIRDLLGAGLGLWNANEKNDARDESVRLLQEAATKAQDEGRKITDRISGNFKPYMDTGVKANADLAAMVGNNNLADLYKPITTSTANIPAFKPIKALTLADLAKTKR